MQLASKVESNQPRRRWMQRLSWLILWVALGSVVLYSASTGAYELGVRQTFHVFWNHAIDRLEMVAIWSRVVDLWDRLAGLPVISSVVGTLDNATSSWRRWLTPGYSARDDAVIRDIRAPRVLLGSAVGGLIALGATLIQAVFRNPLADPGLTGVSTTGAWVALLTTFVPTWGFAANVPWTWDLRIIQPIAAALACLLAVLLLWVVSRQHGAIEPISFVLTGIALNAVMLAAIGLTNAINGDVLQQATSFWAAGSLSQATWYPVQITWTVLILAWAVSLFLGRLLNVFALGDREAEHLGVAVGAVRLLIVILASILLGLAASYAGAIAFVGLLVPQLLRSIHGPDLRVLIPQSVLGGAILVVVADLIARTIAEPIEVGIGLVLTIVGGPIFVLLLMQLRRQPGGWL